MSWIRKDTRRWVVTYPCRGRSSMSFFYSEKDAERALLNTAHAWQNGQHFDLTTPEAELWLDEVGSHNSEDWTLLMRADLSTMEVPT